MMLRCSEYYSIGSLRPDRVNHILKRKIEACVNPNIDERFRALLVKIRLSVFTACDHGRKEHHGGFYKKVSRRINRFLFGREKRKAFFVVLESSRIVLPLATGVEKGGYRRGCRRGRESVVVRKEIRPIPFLSRPNLLSFKRETNTKRNEMTTNGMGPGTLSNIFHRGTQILRARSTKPKK